MNHNLFTIVVDFVMIMIFGMMIPPILVVVKPAIIPFEDRMGQQGRKNCWG